MFFVFVVVVSLFLLLMDKKRLLQCICFIVLVTTMTITFFDVELFPAYQRAEPPPSPLPEGKEEHSAYKSVLVDGLPQKVCRGPDGDQQPTCCVEYLPIDTLPYGLNVFGQPKDFVRLRAPPSNKY